MDNEFKFSVEESAPAEELATSADLSSLGINPTSLFGSSSAFGNNSYRFSGSSEAGVSSTVSFNDILSGYSFFQQNNNYSNYSYDIGGYTNGNTTVRTFNESSVQSNSSYTASTFYNVGAQNGYLNNFNNRTGVMNFVDMNISSFTRSNDYVSFDMGNGTSFQSQSSSSTDDIFQYSTDGQNVYYTKLGMTNQDNTFNYTDGVSYIGSTSHQDTLNLSSYNRNVDLRGNEYISIENIDARNSSSSFVQSIGGGRSLTGNAANNTIYVAYGDTLWGSDSRSDDTLYGSGSGGNTYLYGLNEGNDVIYNSVSTDSVYLHNVSISDISNFYEDSEDLVISTYSGDSLRIVGQNGASNFMLSDQSSYSYNRQSHTWSSRV